MTAARAGLARPRRFGLLGLAALLLVLLGAAACVARPHQDVQRIDERGSVHRQHLPSVTLPRTSVRARGSELLPDPPPVAVLITAAVVAAVGAWWLLAVAVRPMVAAVERRGRSTRGPPLVT